MRPSHLHQLAWGSQLASRELSQLLFKALLEPAEFHASTVHCQAHATLLNRCVAQMISTLEQRWPRRYRLNELERSARQLCCDGLFSQGRLPALEAATERFIQRDGDHLRYRGDSVQTYAALAAELDPQLLAAWHLAGWLHSSVNHDEHDVRRVINAQPPMLGPLDGLHRRMADNHVHLNGVAGDDAVMVNVLLQTAAPKSGKAPGLKEVIDLRPWVEVALRLQPTLADAQLESRLPVGDGETIAVDWHAEARRIRRAERRVIFPWGELANVRLDRGDLHWIPVLRQELSRAMHEGRHAQASLWFWVLLLYRYRAATGTTASERIMILGIISGVMAERRHLIVDKPGIRYFTREYFSAGLRDEGLKEKRNHWREAARRLLQGPDDVAEIKIGPKTFDPAAVATFAAVAGGWQRELQAMQVPGTGAADIPANALAEQVRGLERWHFCVHFIRPDIPFDTPKEPGFRYNQRRKNWEAAKALDRKLTSESRWSATPFLIHSDALNMRFLPGRWIRGLDVAGDESGWPIEYFAAQLRWLRRGLLPRGAHEPASPGFHLSVHAGEDYGHPLSGMRHVDETVRFCQMRDGDRLGHALALGISPAEWMERHGEMLIPVEEHLDNLVWSWGQARDLSHRLPLASQVLPRLEHRIGRMARMVGWLREIIDEKSMLHGGSALPDVLWSAWQFRRNCAWQLSFRGAWPSPEFDVGVPDWRELEGQFSDEAVTSRTNEEGRTATSTSLAAKIFRKRVEQERMAALDQQPESSPDPGLVRVVLATRGASVDAWRAPPRSQDQACVDDEEDDVDVEWMHALQDRLLDDYAQRGLAIEANPTSNLYIARLTRMADHPIFRWTPPDPALLEPGKEHNRFGLRRGAIPVLINTDDPGIMPTTLRMEYELLRDAAMDLGHARHQVNAWLEELRQAGVEHFQRNHEPVFGRP